MARFPGDGMVVTTHMIMITDFMLAKRKHIVIWASEGERVMHSEYWRITQLQSWKGS